MVISKFVDLFEIKNVVYFGDKIEFLIFIKTVFFTLRDEGAVPSSHVEEYRVIEE